MIKGGWWKGFHLNSAQELGFFFVWLQLFLKYLLLTRQEHSGLDSADSPILDMNWHSRPSCLQLQAQTKFVTTSIDILPIHQCRQE